MDVVTHSHEWISQWNHWYPCDCSDVDRWLECLGCGEQWRDYTSLRWQAIWNEAEKAPEDQ